MSILDAFSLKGKVAIVTGSSTGLGQGMCLGLAEAGADIVGIDYVDSNDTKVMVESMGRKFLSITANLITIKPTGLKDLVNMAVEHFGHVDILVNNAGIIRREDTLEFSEQNWDDVMNINLKTVFFFSQAVANQFIKQGNGGKIISQWPGLDKTQQYQNRDLRPTTDMRQVTKAVLTQHLHLPAGDVERHIFPDSNAVRAMEGLIRAT